MRFDLQHRLAERRALVPTDSDAYRLLDGTAWPGVFIDRLAGCLLVSLRDTELPREAEAQLRAWGGPVYLKQLDRDV